MDRRKAIKNIGTGVGAITLTPSIATIFQSCQSSTGYIPVFIPKRDFNSISQIMELIIPTTDTPGAIELKLPEFLDAYVDAVWSQDRKEDFSKGWEAFKYDTLNSNEKEKANQITKDNWEEQLSKYLKQPVKSSETDEAALKFANELRDLTINSYKINEYVGENLLAYSPIPGDYKGCVDLEETTGGKAWSL